MNLDKIKKLSILGIIFGAISLVISYLINTFGSKIPSLIITFAMDANVRNQMQSGVSPKVGDVIISHLSGFIPFTIPGAIAVLISGIAVAFIGYLIMSLVSKIDMLRPKTELLKVISIFIVGSLITGLVLAGISAINMSLIGGTIALGIYGLIVGLIIYGLDKINLVKIPQL